MAVLPCDALITMVLCMLQPLSARWRRFHRRLANFEKTAQHLVDLTCATLQNFSVVGSLLFGATFLAVLGRPTPWRPSEETVEMIGADASAGLMWVAYLLACAITTLCLTTIVYSVGSRYMLTYILQSHESKLCLLCELNPV